MILELGYQIYPHRDENDADESQGVAKLTQLDAERGPIRVIVGNCLGDSALDLERRMVPHQGIAMLIDKRARNG